jgi:hypothetical protein
MTKAELIATLEAQDFCGKVIGVQALDLSPTDYKTTSGIKLYHVHYMEIVLNVARCTKIPMYVFDEGTAKEAAYYGEREPARQIPKLTAEKVA